MWPWKTTARAVPADVEELRRTILDDIDAILEAPWVVRPFITEDSRRLLRAMREYWRQCDYDHMEKIRELLLEESSP